MAGIARHLRRAWADPDDRAARESMMLGATQAGMAFSNSSVALVHGKSRPIGTHFHVPHGLSNAMLLPLVTAFSALSAEQRWRQLAPLMAEEAAASGSPANNPRVPQLGEMEELYSQAWVG